MSNKPTTDISLATKVVNPISLDNLEQFPALAASIKRKDLTISGKEKVTNSPVFFKTASAPVAPAPVAPAPVAPPPVAPAPVAPPPVAPAPVAPVLYKFNNTTNVCFANSACNLILNSPLSNLCRDGALEAISAFRHDPSMVHDVRDVLQTIMEEQSKIRDRIGENYLDQCQHDPAELLEDIITIIKKGNRTHTLEASFNEVETCLACNHANQKQSIYKIYKLVNNFVDTSIQDMLSDHPDQSYCRHCQIVCPTTVATTPIILPQTLILQANRIHCVDGKLTKHNYKLDANKIITIGQEQFQLKSLIVHHGQTTTSGHYTILIYNNHTDSFTRGNDAEIETEFDPSLIKQGIVFSYVRIECQIENYSSPMKQFPQQSMQLSTTTRSPMNHSPVKPTKRQRPSWWQWWPLSWMLDLLQAIKDEYNTSQESIES